LHSLVKEQVPVHPVAGDGEEAGLGLDRAAVMRQVRNGGLEVAGGVLEQSGSTQRGQQVLEWQRRPAAHEVSKAGLAAGE
jgi:hypothetical protein